jgi:hypothetical protein
MLTDQQLTTLLSAPKVTAELASEVGVGVEYIYRLRRRHGTHKDLRYKTDSERVLRYTETATGCWEWTGSTDMNGYGRLGEWRGEKSAHRASYTFHKGSIPEGRLVLHSCDNRRCINPAHLRLGNHSDNNLDAYKRRRRPDISGERNGNAKLTTEQAAAIKSDTRRQADIAQEFGVSTSLVSAIKKGTAWRTANATQRAQMQLR